MSNKKRGTRVRKLAELLIDNNMNPTDAYKIAEQRIPQVTKQEKRNTKPRHPLIVREDKIVKQLQDEILADVNRSYTRREAYKYAKYLYHSKRKYDSNALPPDLR